MVDRKSNPVFLSADGRQYALLTMQGDVARDGVVATLLAGRLDSLESASPRVVAQFFTRGLGSREFFGETSASLSWGPFYHPLRWLDDHRVTVTWDDEHEIKQILSVDIRTREVRYLTHHPTPITSYAIGPSGVVTYTALSDGWGKRSADLLYQGFAVSSRDALSLLYGNVESASVYDRFTAYERFIVAPADPKARKVAMTGGGVNRVDAPQHSNVLSPSFSPNGRWLLVAATPSKVPDDWRKYAFADFPWDRVMRARTIDPNSPDASTVSQLFVVDIERSVGRPLWNAPAHAGVNHRLSLAWSANSQTVLLGPTELPAAQADEAGLAGNAVAEVDIATGRYWQLPVPSDAAASISSLRWISDDVVELTYKGQVDARRFRKSDGAWRALSKTETPSDGEVQSAPAPVHIELRQDLNTPPAFFAVETATGRARLVFDPNPQLRADRMLGRVEIIHWKAPDGRSWSGRLYLPVNYTPQRRYPLVVQPRPASATDFSIYGPKNAPALGPGVGSFLAQQLANRQIAVLQVGGPDEGRGVDSPESQTIFTTGREAGIEHLVATGLIDRNKVGLEGYSSLGRQVEHDLTFSEFPYAAAVANDYSDRNHLQSILEVTGIKDFPHVMPFDEAGLSTILKYSPAFHIQRIRTPLQIIVNGPGYPMMVTNWEMFAGLRYLKKPVEMFVVSDMQRGAHALQNPRQILAVQQRGLDWWCFWLKGEEDPDVAKADQYIEWRKLRALHSDDLKKPRPPLTVWKAIRAGLPKTSVE